MPEIEEERFDVIGAGTVAGAQPEAGDEAHFTEDGEQRMQAVLGPEAGVADRDAVLMAVNLGDDADTIGAVTGQIAGAFWGYEAIPLPWRQRLAWEADIRERAVALFGLAQANAVG